MSVYNRLLLRVCRRRGIECVDAAGQLPKSSEIFYDDVHLTEEGSRRLASLVAGRLREGDVRDRPEAGLRAR